MNSIIKRVRIEVMVIFEYYEDSINFVVYVPYMYNICIVVLVYLFLIQNPDATMEA